MIGIDTESRVARTSLDREYDILATVQIATPKNVFIFDAIGMRKNKVKYEPICEFFKKKDVKIIGHTLAGDMNHDVTSLFGYTGKVECQQIDVSPLFGVLYPEERRGLTNVCKVLLGKELCKQYTMTNW